MHSRPAPAGFFRCGQTLLRAGIVSTIFISFKECAVIGAVVEP